MPRNYLRATSQISYIHHVTAFQQFWHDEQMNQVIHEGSALQPQDNLVENWLG